MKAVPIPIIEYDAQRAEQAFAAHRALLLTELRSPGLADNPQWQSVRDYAFRLFNRSFEAM